MPIEQNLPQYLDQNSKNLCRYFLDLVHFLPSWLVWARNRVYGACCSTQTVHKPVQISSAKQTTGAKTLLFKYKYCAICTEFCRKRNPLFVLPSNCFSNDATTRNSKNVRFLRKVQHNGFREKFIQQSYLRPIFIQILSRFYLCRKRNPLFRTSFKLLL